MTSAFRVEVLGAGHARDGFSCGAEALDIYFARQATQDVRRRASACYVAGDLVVGDSDGVVIIPREDLSAVLVQVRAIARWEDGVRGSLAAGAPFVLTEIETAL